MAAVPPSSSPGLDPDRQGRLNRADCRQSPILPDQIENSRSPTAPSNDGSANGGAGAPETRQGGKADDQPAVQSPIDSVGREDSEDEDIDAEDVALVLESDPETMAGWAGQPSIKGSSEIIQMVLLNLTAIGITFTWGIEMTYCTPYLLNLGLTKSNTSLVWIAGPLSGLIVQPVVGVVADGWRSKWGRRRPFIVVGTAIVAASLLTLGFTKEIVGLFVSEPTALRKVTIVFAVLSIYAVDFAINAVMSCARSLIVDTLPMEKQQAGAAWASRMGSVGHVLGYGAGALDLVSIFGKWMGDTQFKQLTIIATFSIITTSAVTCWAVTERVLVSKKEDGAKGGRFKVVRQIWSTLLHLPPRIQAICWAQFWSWIGWFPFLFYSTTWVGETYFRYNADRDTKDSGDALGDIGRIGSTALVVYSCITFLGAWGLPLFVQSPDDNNFTHRPPKKIANALERFNKVKPSLLTVWICGHLIFAASMSLAPFARSFRFATALVAVCGIPWSIAMWAPTTFLGVEVNRMSGSTDGSASYQRLPAGSNMELRDMRQGADADPDPDTESAVSATGELSGIYFGILNIYTTLPQFVGTFISTIVFAILEPGKSPELATDAHPSEHHSTDGPNAIAVCLFIGAMSALAAAYVTRRLKYL